MEEVSMEETSLDMARSQCGSDLHFQSRLVADAGEDISLQNILGQRPDEDESGIGSERTDLIINDSGAMNTSEDFIEQTVSASGTLG